MKTTFCSLALTAALAPAASSAIYTDAVGDFTGGPSALDMVSVSVNNDAATLTFNISLAGDPTAADWYQYYIGVSRNLFGGTGGNFNSPGGWGKNIQMSTGGMDYLLASYPFWGGYDLFTWNGLAWTSVSGLPASEDSSSVTLAVSLAQLGLAVGDSFTFDVWTSSGGSDTVLDALSDSTARSWNSAPFDTGANALTYTVPAIPEPASFTLLGLGALILFCRRDGSVCR